MSRCDATWRYVDTGERVCLDPKHDHRPALRRPMARQMADRPGRRIPWRGIGRAVLGAWILAWLIGGATFLVPLLGAAGTGP